MSIPKRKLNGFVQLVENITLQQNLPSRVLVLAKDLAAYRNRVHCLKLQDDSAKKDKLKRDFMNVLFHNKGLDMINLPKLLNSTVVMKSVPDFLDDPTPPIVSYTYTKTISSKIFNDKKVMEDLDMNIGTQDMKCNCSSSAFKYEPLGHVVTGNLSIIKDSKLRQLIKKGPSYREQNNINWNVNAKICIRKLFLSIK